MNNNSALKEIFDKDKMRAIIIDISSAMHIPANEVMHNYLPFFIDVEKIEKEYGSQTAQSLKDLRERNGKHLERLNKKYPHYLDSF